MNVYRTAIILIKTDRSAVDFSALMRIFALDKLHSAI